MSEESCPLPSADRGEGNPIDRMLSARRIAIVGLSDDPSRPSHGIAQYLISAGKEVVPVNPTHTRVLGMKSYPSLESVPGRIDLVNVFRRAEHCVEVVQSSIAVGAGGVWLQSGIVNEEARRWAERAGIDFVQNRCIMVEHMHRR